MTCEERRFSLEAVILEIILKRISSKQMGRRLDGSVGSFCGLGMKITFLLRRDGERMPFWIAVFANLRRSGLMTG